MSRLLIYYFLTVLCFTYVQGSYIGQVCNGRGFPIDNTSCSCFDAFSGDNCQLNIALLQPVIYKLYRSTVIIFNVLILCIVAYLLWKEYNSLERPNRLNISFWWSKRFVIIWIGVIALQSLIHFSVDPLGLEYVIDWKSNRFIFFAPPFPLMVILLSGLLMHWIHLSQRMVASLRREINRMRANSKYNPQIKFEELCTDYPWMRRSTIPIYFMSIYSIVFVILRESFIVTLTLKPSHWFCGSLFLTSFALIYIAYVVGFFYYGRQVVRISAQSDRQSKSRAVSVIMRVRIITVSMAVFFSILILCIEYLFTD